ncbi:MAG: DUF2924 domain-containing protein [Acidobacteria bacterium]|nr:DUF2924 domain-containing protein [Acidobacteriota bacterium]
MREQIEGLRHMTVGQLKYKYLEVFGEESRSNHKQFLFRRIAWRIQANVEGGLSERARRRALEIANDADLRIRAPKNFLKEALDETRTVESRVSLLWTLTPNSPSTLLACGRIWTNTPAAWWPPAKLWNSVMGVFRGSAAPVACRV